jgi:WD40 repeat protein
MIIRFTPSRSMGSESLLDLSIRLSVSGPPRLGSSSFSPSISLYSPFRRLSEFLVLLQGHTSLVGQLQLDPVSNVLVTGGSDGRVIVYNLTTFETQHRLCAHDNSVTCLQFDDRFIVTGGNDGRIKLWGTSSLSSSPLQTNRMFVQTSRQAHSSVNSQTPATQFGESRSETTNV